MAGASSPNSLLSNPNCQSKSSFLKNPNSNPESLPTPISKKSLSISCTTLSSPSPPLVTKPLQDRLFNFAAEQATLPETMILKAQSKLFNWRGSCMSIMEMSHRGKEFLSVMQKAELDLRELLKIPNDYEVLFLQGGATTQFASIPLNLCNPGDPLQPLQPQFATTQFLDNAMTFSYSIPC